LTISLFVDNIIVSLKNSNIKYQSFIREDDMKRVMQFVLVVAVIFLALALFAACAVSSGALDAAIVR
jgi:hypothetical protein